MMRRVTATSLTLLLGLLLLAGESRAEPRRFEIDPNHFSVGFLVHHIGYHDVLGMFLEAGGSFVFDEEARTLSELTIEIESDSVFTNHKARDKHLRSPEFLNVREFPQIRFVMTGAEPTGERTGKITGDLTLIGVTRPVTLDLTWNKSGRYPFPTGSGKPNYVVGASAHGSIRRSEFGMTYGVDNGWVGDEIKLILELEAIRQE
jgi:polyisoprenoid-binding protein YceI